MLCVDPACRGQRIADLRQEISQIISKGKIVIGHLKKLELNTGNIVFFAPESFIYFWIKRQDRGHVPDLSKWPESFGAHGEKGGSAPSDGILYTL